MIKLGFYKGRSLISKVIQLITRGPYSHVVLSVNENLYEARELHGVQKLTHWPQNQCDIDIFSVSNTLSPEKEKELINFLDSQVGKPYDYLMAMGFIWYATKETRKSSGQWFCSELVAASLDKFGIKLLKNVPAWKVHPNMLSYSNLLNFDGTLEYRP